MDILILIAGIAMLIVGAEIFVNSSVSIAKKMGIPTVVIALTVIAIGTSAPETVISINASVKGHCELSMSNIIGSNFFNLMFIVGICALIWQMDVKLKEVGTESWLMVGSNVLLFLVMIASLLWVGSGDRVPRIVGVVMVVTFIVYLSLLLRHVMQSLHSQEHVLHRTPINITQEETKPLWLVVIGVIFGLAIILWGGEITVDHAGLIAKNYGVSPRIIGLTIIGAGTSLPELIISATACMKRQSGIALGTIVGTNIYNLLFILGVAGTIDPLLTVKSQMFDMAALSFGNMIFLIFILAGKRLNRLEGAIMLTIYFGYLTYMFLS